VREKMNKDNENRIRTLKAHVALSVKDVPRSIEFYKKMLGIDPCKVRTGYAKFDIASPPLNLTLNQGSPAQSGALWHLGIQVFSTGDVLAMRERWIDSGLPVEDEMRASCCYAVQDKTWVVDPDGNRWEVFVVLEDNLPEKVESEPASCCVDRAAPVTIGGFPLCLTRPAPNLKAENAWMPVRYRRQASLRVQRRKSDEFRF
jgi:catechol 2,3-dioxygenase-like lactoylglutathione lyase family enzyme